MVAMREATVAKRSEKREDKAIKVERDIVTKLAFVADRRGTSVAELASDILRGPAHQMWEEELARFQEQEQESESTPTPKRKKGGA